MTGFTVDADALVAFAERCDGYATQMDTLVQRLHDARVGRDAFGHIPSVGSRIHTAYDQHVDHATQATTDAASALHAVSTNAALTAAHYLKAEKNSTIR